MYEKVIEKNTQSIVYQKLFWTSFNSNNSCESNEVLKRTLSNNIFETNLEFMTAGIESIIQVNVI